MWASVIISWRYILRNKLYSIINVLGLTIGVSSCLIIFLIVNFEFSFDRHHPDSGRIYRVYSQFKGTYSGFNRGVPAGIAGAARNDLTGLEAVVGLHSWSANVEVQDEIVRKDFGRQERITLTGPEFFDVFSSYKWIEGNPSKSLSQPFQVVLTESQAKKYFNIKEAKEAIGRQIHYRDSLVVNVSGIIADVGGNSDLDFTDFISLSTARQSWLKNNIRLEDWGGTSSSSILFVKLQPSVTLDQIEQALVKLSYKYMEADAAANVVYKLQPLSNLHFNADLEIFDHSRPAASISTLRSLVAIALLILSIASINFINLEIAQAIKKAKEVGVRKIMGSSRAGLVMHFLMQSALLTGFAILLSLPIVSFSLKFFSEFIPPGIKLHSTDIVFLFLLMISVTFLAGIYPAFLMSSVSPLAVLKNHINNYSIRSSILRKGLIVFQFTFAQVLILATIIVGRQLNYISNKDLGFEKDAIIYFNAPWWESKSKTHLLMTELEKLTEIEAVSLNSRPPASIGWNASTIKFNNGKEELEHNVYLRYGDTTFIHVFGMKLLAGRNVQRSDTVKEFIINETYCNLLGFKNPQQALGGELYFGKVKFPIIGVIKNFHFQSLHTPIKPIVIADTENNYTCFGIKLASMKNGGDFKKSIEKIDIEWSKVYPDQKLEYQFMDEAVRKFYEKENRFNKLVKTATFIAILISCMGLFGLASFTASQRIKELSIRKILGASPAHVLGLLSKEFFILIVIAFACASPLAYFIVEKWLQQFAYQTDVSWWIFPVTLSFAVFVAMFSVCHQVIKVIFINPAESLRCE